MKISDRATDMESATRRFRSANASIVGISIVTFPIMIFGVYAVAEGALAGVLIAALGLFAFLRVATSHVVLSANNMSFERWFRTLWRVELSSSRAVDGVADGVLPALQIFHSDGRMIGSILKTQFDPNVIEQVRAAINQAHPR